MFRIFDVKGEGKIDVNIISDLYEVDLEILKSICSEEPNYISKIEFFKNYLIFDEIHDNSLKNPYGRLNPNNKYYLNNP